jgi:hypothetical protein
MERVEEIIPGEYICNAAFRFFLHRVVDISMCMSQAGC